MIGFHRIPNSWVWTRVDQVGEVRLGRQRAPQHHSGPHMFPYLRVANVFENRIDTRDVLRMNFELGDAQRYLLQHGDVLLNEGQSRELVGRPAMFRGEVPGARFQNTLVRFRSDDFVVSEYALGVFRHYFHAGHFQNLCKWTTNIAHLGADRFAGMPFPLAPLTEQKRIAIKVDALLVRVSACRERLDRVPSILKRFRQAVLAAATSGELTRDWREASGRDLGSWTRSTVGKLIERIEAGLNVQCDERPPVEGERGLVKISAVTWGTYDDNESKTLRARNEVPDATRIRVGDFLISRANTLELVGACVIVQRVSRPVFLSDKVLRLVLPDEWKQWLLFVLSSPEGRRQIENRASGNQLSMRNLSQGNLREISVPMPPPDERAEIVRRVQKMFDLADGLVRKVEYTTSQLSLLPAAVLAKAFRGELVPQDPSDEPASQLIDRFRASLQRAVDGQGVETARKNVRGPLLSGRKRRKPRAASVEA